MDPPSAGSTGQSRWWISPVDLVDVFVYVVILNLAAEYFPKVMTETFTLSLLTAILLKVVLEVVIWVEHLIKVRLKAATTSFGRIFARLLLLGVLMGSKFIVLELVAFFFADQVQLGGFFAVTGLIVALMVSRTIVHRMLEQPGA